MRYADDPTKPFTLSKHALLLAIAFPLFAASSINTSNAQSSSLPATNMGKFVHQPGDNQYSDRTQTERHSSPQPILSPAAVTYTPAQAACYVPAPRVAKPDPTLSYIAADEPIHQAGFPPLPDRADLPNSGSLWINSRPSGISVDSNKSDGTNGSNAIVGKKNPAGYNQVPAGAYIPKGINQKYHSSNPNEYNTAIVGGGNANSQTGKEPLLDPRRDQGIAADAPTPIVVKQPTTQDLSLPDDEFSGTNALHKKNPSGAGSMINQLEKRAIINPITQMGSRGAGMMNTAIRF